jgi:hypothetical protein
LDTVLITLVNAAGATDLEVPADVPVRDWLEPVVGDGALDHALVDGRPLVVDRSLAEMKVYDGARILLDPAGGASGRAAQQSGVEAVRVTVDGRYYTFPARRVTVGRGAACDIRATPKVVSREHVSISPSSDGWMVDDLDTANGTWVDGSRRSKVRVGGAGKTAAFRLGHPTMGPLVQVEVLAGYVAL